jgi:homospermidine synthase
LPIARAREHAPLNNATSLQVVSSIIGGLEWMLAHPREGVVESDHLDHAALLDRVSPYWEPMQRCYTSWRPTSPDDDLSFDSFLVAGRRLTVRDTRNLLVEHSCNA